MLISSLVEIKDTILGYLLSLPKDLMIRPHPVTTNWKRVWNIHPNYTIDGTRHYQYTRSVHKKQSDKQGEYLEYRRIILPEIDASCLRVHSKLREYGARILYSSNTFAFSMVNRHLEHCPPYLLNKVYRPSHQKPNTNCPTILSAMGHICDGHRFVQQDRLRIIFDHLHGWAYFDPFLRFLYTIQPQNAASIKTLSFDGDVQRHNQCSSTSCLKTGVCLLDDLVMSLGLYILFIRKFCANLEKLIIVACDDYRVKTCRHRDHQNKSLPKSMKETLLPLLENEVRSIRSLRELEVIIKEEKKEEMDDFDFVQETMDWFKGRTAKQDARKREFNARRVTAKPIQERAQWLKEQLEHLGEKLETVTVAQKRAELLQEKSKIVTELCRNCEYCGEEHHSLECYNLCNFCGDAGHWRDTCRKFATAELEWDLERLMNYKEKDASAEEYGCGLESGGELDSGYQTMSGEGSIEEGKGARARERGRERGNTTESVVEGTGGEIVGGDSSAEKDVKSA